jgi:signal transduction histidine kinase
MADPDPDPDIPAAPSGAGDEALLASDLGGAATARLAGGLAHDFNNLLTVMRGNLHLLAVDPAIEGDPELAAIVGEARSAAEEATLRVRGLSILAGTARPRARPIDAAEMLHRQAAWLAGVLGPRIRIEVEAGDDLPRLVADPQDLDAVLLALSLNARDAITGDGEVRLAARASPADGEDGPGIAIRVSDSGRGMDGETLSRARRGGEPAPTGSRAGFGLAIVRRAVAAAGGRVHIASTPEGGTTVTLALPAAPPGDGRRDDTDPLP